MARAAPLPERPAAADPARPALRKGQRTAERILDTAEALFAERGYAGTTLRDVAHAAGLRIPSLYNHFAGKDALYAAVLERGIRPILDLLSEAVAGGLQGDGRRQLVERILGELARRPDLPRLVQHEVLTGGERLSPILSGWFKPAFARAEQTLRAAPGAGRWSDEQVPLLVIALYHVAVGYFATAPLMRALDGTDLLSQPALARQIDFYADLVATLLPEDAEE